MSRTSIPHHVLELLADREPGLLLDIPAGSSPVAAGARQKGWKVVELDLFPPENFDGVQGDACAPLPFADASFDALVSMEGIEHFENQAAFVRECARVLKPGGVMVLTTPNVMHLSARVSAFLTGQRAMKRGFVNEDHTLRGREGTRTYHGHAFLIDVFRLRYLMAIEGLRINRVKMTRKSTTSFLLAPFLLPVVWIATRMCLRSGRNTHAHEDRPAVRPEVEDELRTIADAPGLLLSRKLVVAAVKSS